MAQCLSETNIRPHSFSFSEFTGCLPLRWVKPSLAQRGMSRLFLLRFLYVVLFFLLSRKSLEIKIELKSMVLDINHFTDE